VAVAVAVAVRLLVLVFVVVCVAIGVRTRRLPFEQNPQEFGQPVAFLGCPRCRIECSGVAIL
jgi:hypothetical protein